MPTEHAFMIWFRSANSHTGPQLHCCIRGRTDGSIRLRANLLQKPLASRGASTDEYTPLGRRFTLPLPSPPAEQAATRQDQAVDWRRTGQSISYFRYFGLLPGIFWPLASLGTLFEVLFKVLYQNLALFFLHAGMLDGDFQAILLRMVCSEQVMARAVPLPRR